MFLTQFQSNFNYPNHADVKNFVGVLAGQQASNRLALYRYDQQGSRATLVLMTRDEIPQATIPNWDRVDLGRYDLSPAKEGDVLRFKTRVNLSICQGGKRRDFVEHYRKENGCQSYKEALLPAALAWFGARPELGFVVDTVQDIQQCSYRKFDNRGNTVTFPLVDIEGRIKVQDTSAFRRAIEDGIGREKAFGAGLMLVRK